MSTAPRRMTAHQIATGFLNLPYHVQIGIMRKLLPNFRPEPPVQSDADFFKDCVGALNQSGRLTELEIALEENGVKLIVPPAVPSGPIKQCCDVCKRIPCACEISEDDDAYGEPGQVFDCKRPLRPTIQQFQQRMTAWGARCFGQEHMEDRTIRGMRLLEEAIEFAQSVEVPAAKAHALIDYVYGRPAGKPEQELGGVAVTMLVAASSLGKKADEIIMAEVTRVEAKSPEHFAARNKTKIDLGFTTGGEVEDGNSKEKTHP